MDNVDKNNDEGKNSFWLNSQENQKCGEDRNDNCKEREAREGNGLEIVWKESGEPSGYSRLTGGPQEENCVLVERQSGEERNRVWRTIGCDYDYRAACVRRNCAAPKTT